MTGKSCLGLAGVLVLVSACMTSGATPAQPGTSSASATPAAATAEPSSPPTISRTPTPAPTPAPTSAPTPIKPFTTDEPTRYEGTLKYDCDAGGCWRQGSKIGNPSKFYYPEIEANNAEIAALLSDIGLPADPIDDDATQWRTMQALWAWLQAHASDPTTAPEAWNYLASISVNAKPDHWPSIANFASTYARYETIPWAACNSRALTFATLAYRVGLNPDRLAVAYFKSADASIQHFYVVLRSGGRWLYIDPTCNTSTLSPSLSSEPASVGCVDRVDYEHPFTLALLPDSTLTRAMLVK